MKEEVMSELTEKEMLKIGGGKSKVSKVSFTAAGIVLAIDSVVLAATCSPVVGAAALGTAIACMEAAKDEEKNN